MRSPTCTCTAYRFPHRPGGGSCWQTKHCNFGDRQTDWIEAMLAELGVSVSSLCDHVQEVDETCVACSHLCPTASDPSKAVAALAGTLHGANQGLADLGLDAKVGIGMTRRP